MSHVTLRPNHNHLHFLTVHVQQKRPAVKEECAPELEDDKKWAEVSLKLRGSTTICDAAMQKRKQRNAETFSAYYIHKEGKEELSCRCKHADPGVWHPGWWSYLQQPAAVRLRSCIQHWICSTIVFQPAPLVSTSLSHTLIVWALLSPPSVSVSPPPSPPSPLLSHSHTLPHSVLNSGNRQNEGAAWMLCPWGRPSHVDRDTAVVYHTPFLSLSPSQTQQLTHRHAPRRQMGIPGLDVPARPIRGKSWPKAAASFTRSGL